MRFINNYKILNLLANKILMIFFLIVRRILRHNKIEVGNLIVISLHKIGDSIFTIPAIKALQKYFNRPIIVICYAEVASIFNNVLSNIRTVELNRTEFYLNLRIAKGGARKKIKQLNPEIILDLTGAITSATLIFNSRARIIAGINHDSYKPIYDHFSRITNDPHLIDKYINAVETIIPEVNRETLKVIPKQQSKSGRILIHPFAGWRAKEWGFRKFILLAAHLSLNHDILLIIPKNSVKSDVLSVLKNKKLSYLETNNMQELLSIMQDSALFIGNDSGPAHLANLFGRPTLTIFGPTNPLFCAPLGEQNVVVSTKIKCSPSPAQHYCFTNAGRNGCPSYECMNSLSFKEVLKTVEEFISKNQIAKSN